jgi:hypothetical protein
MTYGRGVIRQLLAACACAGLAAGVPHVARATVGGPEIAEPMGYDARSHSVYFRELHWNESDVFRCPSSCRASSRS